jgi:hypothetical protein
MLRTRGVVRQHQVDVNRLHVVAQHEPDATDDLKLPRLLQLEEIPRGVVSLSMPRRGG